MNTILNRGVIEVHPIENRIGMIKRSSINPAIIAQVQDISGSYELVQVCLDSNHTHELCLLNLRLTCLAREHR
jgi:cephalosporin hydroxylase